jgi:hypothetical protein
MNDSMLLVMSLYTFSGWKFGICRVRGDEWEFYPPYKRGEGGIISPHRKDIGFLMLRKRERYKKACI